MADTSKRIIILSALILVVIIIWFPNSGQMRTIVTINDVEVEIETPRDSYTLGENFTATVHIVNNGSKDIWMNPIIELAFLGSSLYDPEPNTGVILLDWGQGAMIHIPAKSKITLFERDFESRYSGEFLITCFGAEKTVLILEQDYTWITATVLTVEHSPNLDVVEISSEDKDIPLSLFVAIDKALLEEVSVQEGGQSEI